MFGLKNSANWAGWLVPAGIIACLLIIFVPMPAGVMDILLATNITVALIILLTTVYVRTPIELSIFPTLLLGTTVMRLALNIASTRLILSRGAIDGDMAAGQVIHSFGSFVAGNEIAIGLVIFAIIVVVQFVVITKGATRISEVSARFALDGMPGKQMAIDAEVNAGTMTHEQAVKRRDEVAQHADFYGAMDGASKFVRGDAIAAVIITFINIAAGLGIGMSKGMSISAAAETFTTLTVGDGLVSQLPALLISVAAGLLLTRGTRQSDLPKDTIDQLFARPEILIITAGFLGLMVFTQLPALPLLVLASICGGGAYWILSQRTQAATNTEIAQTAPTPPAPPAAEQPIEKLLENDVLELELGLELVPLAEARKGGTLMSEIAHVRQSIAKELGVILPKVRVRDNLSLPNRNFQILLHGNLITEGEIHPDKRLLVDCRTASDEVTIATTTDFQWCPHAGWIDENIRGSKSATSTLSQTLEWIAKRYASELLTRDATKVLLDEKAKQHPTVVSELIPNVMKLGQLQHVLSALVFEGVSIRPLHLILETLSDHAPTEKDLGKLVEAVRKRLGRQISHQLRTENRRIACFGISEELSHRVSVGFEPAPTGFKFDLPRSTIEKLKQSIEIGAEHMTSTGKRPVLLVDQSIRPVMAWLVEDMLPQLFVLGEDEVSQDTLIDMIAEITTEDIVSTSEMAA